MHKLATRFKHMATGIYSVVTKQSWKLLVPAGIGVTVLVGMSGWLIKEQIVTHNEVAQHKTEKAKQAQDVDLTEQGTLPAPAPTAPSTATTSALPPYDPRSVGPLQPSPDKPPIPKTQKPLILHPSSVTIYKNTSGAQGAKGDGATEASIVASTGDGRSLYYPTSTGSVLLTASDFAPRASWTMKLSSSYASVGTTSIPISAVAVDGSASYVGSLQVTTLPLPSFTITPYVYLDMQHSLHDGNYSFGTFIYSDSFNGAYKPSVSIIDAGGLTCDAYYTFNDGVLRCGTTHALPAGMYTPSVVFENQFQKLTFKTQINVLPY